jgi:hypothetical protein
VDEQPRQSSIPDSIRIGGPMTYDEAYTWLTSGQSPAGRCTVRRARELLTMARTSGFVHMTLGSDLRAPGRLLTRDGDCYAQIAAPTRTTTPHSVNMSLRSEGLPVSGRQRGGWSTLWGTGSSVRVSWRDASPADRDTARRVLQRHGWQVETIDDNSGTWLRVTQAGESEETG